MKACPVCDHSLADEDMTCARCGFSLHPLLGISAEQANQRLHERRQQWQAQHPVNPQPETTPAQPNTAPTQINGVNINSGLVNLEKDPFETMDEYKKRLETGCWEVGNLRMLVDKYNSEKSIMPVEITLLPVLADNYWFVGTTEIGIMEDSDFMGSEIREKIYIILNREIAKQSIFTDQLIPIFSKINVDGVKKVRLYNVFIYIDGGSNFVNMRSTGLFGGAPDFLYKMPLIAQIAIGIPVGIGYASFISLLLFGWILLAIKLIGYPLVAIVDGKGFLGALSLFSGFNGVVTFSLVLMYAILFFSERYKALFKSFWRIKTKIIISIGEWW